VHISGLIGGGLLFATKLGMAIGGALLGYVLAYYDYDPAKAMQSTSEQIFGFQLLALYLPGIAMMLSAVFFRLYKLDEKTSEDFKRQLHATAS
jgi:GPH family glycoside/pentoside/hexuronide:cation symporter